MRGRSRLACQCAVAVRGSVSAPTPCVHAMVWHAAQAARPALVPRVAARKMAARTVVRSSSEAWYRGGERADATARWSARCKGGGAISLAAMARFVVPHKCAWRGAKHSKTWPFSWCSHVAWSMLSCHRLNFHHMVMPKTTDPSPRTQHERSSFARKTSKSQTATVTRRWHKIRRRGRMERPCDGGMDHGRRMGCFARKRRA